MATRAISKKRVKRSKKAQAVTKKNVTHTTGDEVLAGEIEKDPISQNESAISQLDRARHNTVTESDPLEDDVIIAIEDVDERIPLRAKIAIRWIGAPKSKQCVDRNTGSLYFVTRQSYIATNGQRFTVSFGNDAEPIAVSSKPLNNEEIKIRDTLREAAKNGNIDAARELAAFLDKMKAEGKGSGVNGHGKIYLIYSKYKQTFDDGGVLFAGGAYVEYTRDSAGDVDSDPEKASRQSNRNQDRDLV